MIEQVATHPHPPLHADEDIYTKTMFGFWVYIMTDCILFTTFFATYLVLHNNTFGGPSARDLFNLPYALAETLILLTSSFTCGIGTICAHHKQKRQTIGWFAITFFLGIAFLALELNEFTNFVHEGNSWQRSAFLSSFFTLVGAHGLHITSGLLWMFVCFSQVLMKGLTAVTTRRVMCLSLFWHFLDVVWIFIFTIVYLMGVAA